MASKLLKVPAITFLVKKTPPFPIPIVPSIGPLINPSVGWLTISHAPYAKSLMKT